MSVSQSISDLFKPSVPYSATSSIMYNDEGNISGVSGVTYTGDFSGDIWKPTNELGKESFLLLLTTQLKYQDPLSPMENSDFVAQLAQFRALETGENTERAITSLKDILNENMGYQILASQSISNSSAMSLIGREVRMRQATVSYNGSTNAQIPIRVHLGNAESGTVEIRNGDGELIRTLKTSDKDAENSSVVYWDGRMDNGQYAKAGEYSIDVAGSDKNIALYTFVQALVEGVRFTSDDVLVKIDGKEISLGAVLDVSMGEDGGYISQSSALSMMGKVVRARYDSIRHSATEGAEHLVMVNGPANTQMDVEIKDSNGKVVRTLRGHTNEFGTLKLFWDGRSDVGEMCAVGNYAINVVGSDKNPSLYSYIEGVVDGLTSLTGDYKLKVDGIEISVNDIISISTPNS